MNKKVVVGIIIFFGLIAFAFAVIYFSGILDRVLTEEKEETKVVSDKEYLKNIVMEMTLNENKKITSYTLKTSNVEEGNNPRFETNEIFFDGVNNKYKINCRTNWHKEKGQEADEYTNYKIKNADIVTEYRQDYDITTKAWYKETEILYGDGFVYDELWSGGISELSSILDATKIEKIEENVYSIEYDNEYLEKRSEGLYKVGENITGKVYITDGYITKVEMDNTQFPLEEGVTKRTATLEISKINNTIVDIPQDVINSAKDIPN